MREPHDRGGPILHVSLANTGGFAEVIVDDVTVGTAGGLDTLPDGGLDFLLAGFVFTTGGQGPGVLYLDEIVADVTPVACD